MPTARRISDTEGRAAVLEWASGDTARSTIATAVRYALEELAAVAPGNAVEVRVPPYGATQCVAGPKHTRGTPANVVEMDPHTWLSLVTGARRWADVLAAGEVRASGTRADLAPFLPLLRLASSSGTS